MKVIDMKIIDENYTSVRDLMETRIDCYRKKASWAMIY